MLEKLLTLYAMSMAYKVRSPMPHLVGPAGCGKSTYVEQLAEVLDKELHIINVSRLSPLEVEGVQMPHGTDAEMHLRMLPATFWTQLNEGDILLFDEFLRGFPEVYNGLLDIFTSRRVGAFRLPEVFIIGASNSVTSYDNALEDRLLHITVPDPRKSKVEKEHIAHLICDVLGLLPVMWASYEMTNLLDTEVLPTYGILDSFKKKGVKVGAAPSGSSVRNLLGQAQMRMVKSNALKELIDANNQRAMSEQKAQYVLLLKGTNVPAGYVAAAKKIRGNPRLTPVQSLNISMNMQLIEMAQASTEEDDA